MVYPRGLMAIKTTDLLPFMMLPFVALLFFLVCMRKIQIDISARYTTIASYNANVYCVDYPHACNPVGESTNRSSTKFVEITK